MKTSELTGKALDWAVARCEGGVGVDQLIGTWYSPSTNWAQGGPIIERDGISIVLDWDVVGEFLWGATRIEGPAVSEAEGTTPLIAAMRCYVASQLGDEVDVPKWLEELK